MDLWVVSLATQLFTRLPYFLVWGAAIALALTRMQLHPKASKLVLAGATISAMVTVVGVGLSSLPAYWMSQGRSASDLSLVMGVVAGGNSLLGAVGLALVVASVFVERRPSAERSAALPNSSNSL